jgi:hypothetical protein
LRQSLARGGVGFGTAAWGNNPFLPLLARMGDLSESVPGLQQRALVMLFRYALTLHNVFTMEATLTGFEPTFEISRCRAISAQIYGRLRVKRENANRAGCTIRAQLRSSSVRFCPKKFLTRVDHRGDGKRTGANLPAFEVSCVCDDAREFLELIELIQLRLSFFFTAINTAHRLWPSVGHDSILSRSA